MSFELGGTCIYYMAELVQGEKEQSNLIGSLSGLSFAIRTAKMDRS